MIILIYNNLVNMIRFVDVVFICEIDGSGMDC